MDVDVDVDVDVDLVRGVESLDSCEGTTNETETPPQYSHESGPMILGLKGGICPSRLTSTKCSDPPSSRPPSSNVITDVSSIQPPIRGGNQPEPARKLARKPARHENTHLSHTARTRLISTMTQQQRLQSNHPPLL